MTSRWMRSAGLLGALALGPATALAFETVDTLPWPSAGLFDPAYAGDPVAPWSVTAYGGTMYDSNVRRTTTGETADWISRVGVGGRYAARVYGRQSVAIDGYGEYRTYDELSQYNHFAYGLRGQWLWELGNRLAGAATLARTERLRDLAYTSAKEMITVDRFDLTGGYRFHPDWRLTGGVGGRRVANDARAVARNTFGTRAGIEYVSPLDNAVGLEFRYAEGGVPARDLTGVGSFPRTEYEQNEVALTVAYALGETLRLRGRVGNTERTYPGFPASNFSGTTGRGDVEWRLGAKTQLTFEAYRTPRSVFDADALYLDLRGFGMGVHWAPTYKVVLSARGLSERRVFRGDELVASTGLPLRDETVRVIRFGLGWEPERRWQFATAVDFGTRTSNRLARDYDYTAVTANLRYTF